MLKKYVLLTLVLGGFSGAFGYQRTAAETELADRKARKELAALNRQELEQALQALGLMFQGVCYASTVEIGGISYAVPKAIGIGVLAYAAYYAYEQWKEKRERELEKMTQE